MLRNRDEIREDKVFDQLTDAILQRDQPRTTDLFYRMVTNAQRLADRAPVAHHHAVEQVRGARLVALQYRLG